MFNLKEKINAIPNLETRCFSKKHEKLPIRNSGILTVAGTAPCLFDDIENIGIHGDLAAVNGASTIFDDRYIHYDHFITAHIDHFPHTSGIRHTITPFYDDADYSWYFNPGFISSGLLAAWIGLSVGYTKILLLGISLDGTHEKFSEALSRQKQFFYNVKSPSGNTAKILGKPDKDWLNGYNKA